MQTAGEVRRPFIGVTGVLVLVAALFALASGGPAGAGETTTCEPIASGTTLVVPGDNGAKTTLSVNNGRLLVNGEFCDRPSSVFIQDEDEVTSDNLVFEVGAGWIQGNGDPISVATNIKGGPDEEPLDRVEIRAAQGRDDVNASAQGDVTFVCNCQAGQLFSLQLDNRSDVKIDLRGGDDRFLIERRNSSWQFSGKITVSGGPGNDRLVGTTFFGDLTPSAETFIGGPGNDRLDGKAGDDVLRGGGGNDVIIGGAGIDVAKGDAGDDRFSMKDGKAETVAGGAGANTCTCDPSDLTSGI